MSPSSEFTTSALAWYTGVTHEIKPLTSGYRLAIAYNLVNTLPGLPDLHSAVLAVERIFCRWKKRIYDKPKFPETISCLLDRQHSDVSLDSAALKGNKATLISNTRGVAENQ